MKTILKESGVLLLFAVIFFTLASCIKNAGSSFINSNGPLYALGNLDTAYLKKQLTALPWQPLNEEERNSLIYMREEEKLARDVYRAMTAKWGANVFSNILASEQTHMDAILMLLEKYNIPDPVGANGPGVFTNQTLQGIYTKLLAQGGTGLLPAFKTGATIEDLDIYDLGNALTKIDNQDIRLVYENLSRGSRNHMRAFYRNIVKAGGAYTAQYITQAALDAIINADMETGRN
ncbi:MAG: DUF2202 domain-containing protein [Ferruginibacter sp.]